MNKFASFIIFILIGCTGVICYNIDKNATQIIEYNVKNIQVNNEFKYEHTTSPPSKKLSFTHEDLELLAKVIYCEANGCSDRHQQLVAQVVLNRVKSNEFPNTIYDVVYQGQDGKEAIQYSCVNNKYWGDEIPNRCYVNALMALLGYVDCPDDVIYQANFKQGSSVYEKIETSYSITYFCYK